MVSLPACQPERVEYHRRPAFYDRASAQKLPDEVTLEDGTVVKYVPVKRPALSGQSGKPFELREEKEDGSVTLHALLPEHVLVNTLNCLRNEEYQLLWEQVLSDRTKHELAKSNQGVEEFMEFFTKNRHELVSCLTRMVAAIPSQEVSFTKMGEGVTRCKLRPQIAGDFRYRIVDVIAETPQAPDPASGKTMASMLALPEMKLLTIR